MFAKPLMKMDLSITQRLCREMEVICQLHTAYSALMERFCSGQWIRRLGVFLDHPSGEVCMHACAHTCPFLDISENVVYYLQSCAQVRSPE